MILLLSGSYTCLALKTTLAPDPVLNMNMESHSREPRSFCHGPLAYIHHVSQTGNEDAAVLALVMTGRKG